ncbi:MAG: hypothetical protein ACP5SH_13000 [Syntrophobacteraceae bacterium]
MIFEIVGDITNVETIAVETGIRDINRLRRTYGQGRWLKRKGLALVRLADGTLWKAELHWYEASGLGRKEFKIKEFME